MDRKARSANHRIKELELELSQTPIDYDEPLLWMPLKRDIIVVGYLSHDQYSENPIDSCDGMGKFILKHDLSDYLSHVGLTKEHEPDIEEFIEIVHRLRGSEDAWCEENTIAALLMWEEAYLQGKVGTQYAKALTTKWANGYRETSVIERRELVEIVWIPDECLLEHINSLPEKKRDKEAEKCFQQALNEFNAWAEGDCYGVSIDVFARIASSQYDLQDNDSCWGYVGHKWAIRSLKDEFKAHVKHLKGQRNATSSCTSHHPSIG
jgi:hypothetical protein